VYRLEVRTQFDRVGKLVRSTNLSHYRRCSDLLIRLRWDEIAYATLSFALGRMTAAVPYENSTSVRRWWSTCSIRLSV